MIALLLAGGVSAAGGVAFRGGGGGRNDCLAQLRADAVVFHAGAGAKGYSCADGDGCDADATRNGVCMFSASVCINPSTPACRSSGVTRLTVRKTRRSAGDIAPIQAAIVSLGLPSTEARCTDPVGVAVPVRGPDRRGVVRAGRLEMLLRAKDGVGHTDNDRVVFVCVPTTVGGAGPPPTTTSTTLPGPSPTGTPGAGLTARILGAGASPAGKVSVTFTVTDAAGVPIIPVGASTGDPSQARVRFTIAHLDTVVQAQEGVTATFTRYRSYILTTQTSPITHASSPQPTYDSGGTFTATGTPGVWTYTFATALPPGFDGTRTHTIGAQVERSYQGNSLVANPIFDFVPGGGAVTTVRQETTTAQCNSCHDPLEAHGGGRREVRLCQLCHTDQAVDPDTGNSLEFLTMIHKIHRGRVLPSVLHGPVGTKYSIIGFQQQETVFGEKTKACSGGTKNSATCATDADCPGGTCSGEKETGVLFPQDIRNCQKCHAGGPTAGDHLTKPSAAACASCHDDVNPGEVALFTPDSTVPNHMLAPGTNHLAGAQPDAFCPLCHVPTGPEFGLSVQGAHTIPLRSTTLAGLQGAILSASGAAAGPVTVRFRITNGAGTPLDVTSGFDLVAFTIGGPSSDLTLDFEDVAVGAGAGGTLTNNGDGTFTYVSTDSLPPDAAGTWRVGLEASEPVTVNGQSEEEAVPNPVLDFSVDGTPVVPRRTVVSTDNCATCHGTFSKDFSVHGNVRNQVAYCVVCHNTSETDFPARSTVPGASPTDEPIDFKHMIHRLHTGVDQENQPYLVYGPDNAPHDFSDVEYPGDRRDCATCHVNGTQLLPLPTGVLPTPLTTVDTSMGPPVETTTGSIPPTQDACLSCHDAGDARAHAATNTAPDGAEACGVCHEEGRIAAVSSVHALPP